MNTWEAAETNRVHSSEFSLLSDIHFVGGTARTESDNIPHNLSNGIGSSVSQIAWQLFGVHNSKSRDKTCSERLICDHGFTTVRDIDNGHRTDTDLHIARKSF